MKVMVLGHDGRTHALVWKLFNSSQVTQVLCSPGNGGTGQLAPEVDLEGKNAADVAHWAFKEGVDAIIPAVGDWLLEGLVDEAVAFRVGVCGPPQQTVRFLQSRCQVKEFLLRSRLPTAAGRTFQERAKAERFLAAQPLPVVLKSDHSAVGKGVYSDRYTAIQALHDIFEARPLEGEHGGVVIESFLPGIRISISALTDGETVVPLLPTRVFDRLNEGDEGAVAPGMGAHTSTSTFANKLTDYFRQNIFQPMLAALNKEQMSYRGLIGLDCIITDQGPRIISLRCTMRDQETQVVVPRLESDLMELFQATLQGRLQHLPPLQWRDEASVGVALVAEGYPFHFPMGSPIEGLTEVDEGILIFHHETHNALALRYETVASRGADPLSALIMGTESGPGTPITTSGGHVLTLVALAASLNGARGRLVLNAERIHFAGRMYRGDIGQQDFRP